MSLSRAGRAPLRLRPRLLPTLAVLLLLPLLLGLGAWQLDRAAQKRALEAALNAAGDAPPAQILPGTDTEAMRELAYRRVAAYGRYAPERQLLLDNQIHDGRPGFRVFTPLRLGNGHSAVLVDRGWLPMGATRDQLPALALATDERLVRGLLTPPPDVGLRLGDGMANPGRWPRLVQYLDPARLAPELGVRLLPYVIRLDPAAPDGYLREPPALPFGPERHLGYAVQWFALAATLALLWLRHSLVRDAAAARPEPTHTETPGHVRHG